MRRRRRRRRRMRVILRSRGWRSPTHCFQHPPVSFQISADIGLTLRSLSKSST